MKPQLPLLALATLSLLLSAGCPSQKEPVLQGLVLDAYESGHAIRMTDDQGGSDAFVVLAGPDCSFKVPAGGDLAPQPYADMWKSELIVESELGGTQRLQLVCFPGTLALGETLFSGEGVSLTTRADPESPPVPVVVLPNGRVLKVDPTREPTLTLETWEGELASGESFVLHTYSSLADERIEVLPVLAGKAHPIEPGSCSNWLKANAERSFIYRPLTLVKLSFKDEIASGTHGDKPLVLQRTSSKGWTYGAEVPLAVGGD